MTVDKLEETGSTLRTEVNEASSKATFKAAETDEVYLTRHERWNRYLSLLKVFGKTGALTFGGGYAMIALLEYEIVESRGWIDDETFVDMIVVAESTPGPIAVNLATFVGYRRAGFWGGLVATIGVVLPAWLIIVLISQAYAQFRDNAWVAGPLAGIRLAAILLVLQAFFRLGAKLPRCPITWISLSVTLVAALGFGVSAIALLIGGFCLGLWLFRTKSIHGDCV